MSATARSCGQTETVYVPVTSQSLFFGWKVCPLCVCVCERERERVGGGGGGGESVSVHLPVCLTKPTHVITL